MMLTIFASTERVRNMTAGKYNYWSRELWSNRHIGNMHIFFKYMKLLVVCSWKCGCGSFFSCCCICFSYLCTLPLPLNLFRHPLCEGEPHMWGWRGVEVRREKPVILWKGYLWYYGFVNLLSVHFDLSTCVNYLHSLYAAMKLIKEITNQAINWDKPTNALTNKHTAQLVGVEPKSESSHCQHSTYFSPLEDLWVELIELDCNTFKNEVHPHKGGTKKIQGEGQGVQVWKANTTTRKRSIYTSTCTDN